MKMEAPLYNETADKKTLVKLPETIFDVEWNDSLVSQMILAFRANMRKNTTHTKDRSEVRGGGAKPHVQKGTGRARHGSIRSPIWTGGGVTFGPRNTKDYSQKINKKMKNKALSTILSQKLRENSIVFIDQLTFDNPSTKKANDVIEKIKSAEKKKANVKSLVVFSKKDINTDKSMRNLDRVKVIDIDTLNANDAFNAAFILFIDSKESVKHLESRIL